jgi:tight adherence protein B
MLAQLLGVMLVGLAGIAALAWLGWWWDDRTLKRRALEQIGLRDKKTTRQGPRGPRRADLTLVVMALAAGLLGLALLGPVGVLAAAIPPSVVNVQRRRAQRKRSLALVAALAPAVQLVIDNLRVGRDLVSSMAEVSKEAGWPVDEVFATVVAETRLGTRVDEAVARQAEAENERHLRIIASAIGLNVEYGGNLVDILAGVAETLEEEDRLRRNIDTLTADGRMSAQILLALPIVGLLGTSMLSPGYAEPLYSTNTGRAMALVAAVLGGIGFLWLRKLGNPDIVG